jgi:uncharacterized RDD family membrane protein YckC
MKGKRPSPPEESQELSTREARSGKALGVQRYVLAISTVLVIVAFVIVYFAVT